MSCALGSSAICGDGVFSFNGRTGAVLPQAGDYDAADVGGIPEAEKGAAGGVAELDEAGVVPDDQLPAYVPAAAVGAADGVPSLDSGGKVPVSQLPSTITGAVEYKGTWNATTNSPDLPAATPDKGDYYVVSVAGSTSLGGITDWAVGDWAIYNGTAWQKVDNSESVTSVNGRTGTVTGLQDTSEKEANGGYPGLTSDGFVRQARIASGTPTTAKFVRGGAAGDDAKGTWDAIVAGDIPSNLRIGGVSFPISGGGAPISTGSKGTFRIPYAGTITACILSTMTDNSSVTLTLKKCTQASFPGSLVSIVAAAKPTLTNANTSIDSTLSGWTTSVAAGDLFEVIVDTIDGTLADFTIALDITKT